MACGVEGLPAAGPRRGPCRGVRTPSGPTSTQDGRLVWEGGFLPSELVPFGDERLVHWQPLDNGLCGGLRNGPVSARHPFPWRECSRCGLHNRGTWSWTVQGIPCNAWTSLPQGAPHRGGAGGDRHRAMTKARLRGRAPWGWHSTPDSEADSAAGFKPPLGTVWP